MPVPTIDNESTHVSAEQHQTPLPVPPAARRPRPRNRRTLILAAASDLFARHGYDQTGMSDISAAVDIGPSALYRHFSGKQQLLTEVVTLGLRPVHQLVNELDLGDRAATLTQLAALALDQRDLGVLWQREARHMTPDNQAQLRGLIRQIGARLAESVYTVRPGLSHGGTDLLAWSMIAVLTSPSFHHTQLPRPTHDQLLAELLGTVLDTELPTGYASTPRAPTNTPGLTPASRREALLAQAVHMFANHGYTEVGIEDIGSGVNIAGPSVYNHYPSKLDMLTTAFQRGTSALFMDISAAYRTAASPAHALSTLIRSYIAFSHAHHDLISLLITETGHMPPDEQQRARQAQHDYLSEWVHLVRSVHPDLDTTTAGIRVHAAIDVINNAARTPHLRHNPETPAALSTLSTRLLQLPE